MQYASDAITRHLEAVAALTSKVKGGDEAEIEGLDLEARSLERENAVARYERHLASHGEEEHELLRMSA